MLPDLHGRVMIVTGANSGIGKATAAALSDLGAHVVLACRSEARGQAALAELSAVPGRSLTLLRIDLADFSSVRAFAAAFSARFDRLDALVNNAGMLGRKRQLTADGYEMQLQVNFLSHFLLTMLLLPKLSAAPQGRVVMLSSLAHAWTHVHFDDVNLSRDYNRFLGYGQSKLCNLMFCRALAKRLNDAGSRVTINAAHPGIVASDIVVNRKNNALRWVAVLSRAVLLSPKQGARTSVFLAADDSVSTVSGEYFIRCKIAPSSPESKNLADAERLFELAAKITGAPV